MKKNRYLGEMLAAMQQGDKVAAHAAWVRYHDMETDDSALWYYQGLYCIFIQDYGQALSAFDQVTHPPSQLGWHYNRGLAYHHQCQYKAAMQQYQQALCLDPNHGPSLENLSTCQWYLNQLTAAYATARQAVAVNPQSAQGRWNLSLTALSLEHYQIGWQHYEAGLNTAYRPLVWQPQLPRWSPPAAPPGPLVLVGEQGIGDQLMFASLVPSLQQQVTSVSLVVTPRLQPYLQTMLPQCPVLTPSGLERLTAACYLPLGSLPSALQLDLNQPWSPRHSLTLPDVCNPYYDPTKLNVGLSWAGGNTPQQQQQRSLSARALAPWLTCPGIRWYNLQAGPTRTQLPGGTKGVDWIDLSCDPQGPLAPYLDLMQSLDLIITVDNSVAHFAGTLGRPTWLLLPTPANWRWRQHGQICAWYPSVRIFRQTVINAWDPVIACVATQLSLLVAAQMENVVR